MRRAAVRGSLVVVALGLAFVLGGCRGKLIATATLHAPGKATTTFSASGRKLSLWADTDAKWKGPKSSKPMVAYEIDVKQGGTILGHVSCSTEDRGGTSVCGSVTNTFGTHNADCEIQLGCSLPPLPAGEIELAVTGTTGANVISITNLSLNVRAE